MLKILLVDDSKTARARMSMMLKEFNIEYEIVGEAVDGMDALTQFNALQPNLVITDLVMPNMDRMTLCNEIRKISIDTHIIIISSTVNAQIKQAIQTDKYMQYIVKPVKESIVEHAITKIHQLFQVQ
jgi:YesN/AraC family two-component response regulator